MGRAAADDQGVLLFLNRLKGRKGRQIKDGAVVKTGR